MIAFWRMTEMTAKMYVNTVWKFANFIVIEILREIYFGEYGFWDFKYCINDYKTRMLIEVSEKQFIPYTGKQKKLPRG